MAWVQDANGNWYDDGTDPGANGDAPPPAVNTSTGASSAIPGPFGPGDGTYGTPNQPTTAPPGPGYGWNGTSWELLPTGTTAPDPTLPPPPGDPTSQPPENANAAGQTSFSYPAWTPPTENWSTFAPPTPTQTDFSYPDFTPPDPSTIANDPAYQFESQQMQQAVQNAASSTGLLSTGGTLTDLMKYQQGLAAESLNDSYNRASTTYNTNRNNAFTGWQGNVALDNQNYTQDLTSYLTEEQAMQNDWNNSLTAYTTNENTAANSYGLNLNTSALDMNENNSQFANLLSLYGIATRTLPTAPATSS